MGMCAELCLPSDLENELRQTDFIIEHIEIVEDDDIKCMSDLSSIHPGVNSLRV